MVYAKNAVLTYFVNSTPKMLNIMYRSTAPSMRHDLWQDYFMLLPQMKHPIVTDQVFPDKTTSENKI